MEFYFYKYLRRFKQHIKFYIPAFLLLVVAFPEFGNIVGWRSSGVMRLQDFVESAIPLLIGVLGLSILVLTPGRVLLKATMAVGIFLLLFMLNLARMRANSITPNFLTYLFEAHCFHMYIPLLAAYIYLILIEKIKRTPMIIASLYFFAFILVASHWTQSSKGSIWDSAITRDVKDRLLHGDYENITDLVDECKRLGSDRNQSNCMVSLVKQFPVSCGDDSVDRTDCLIQKVPENQRKTTPSYYQPYSATAHP